MADQPDTSKPLPAEARPHAVREYGQAEEPKPAFSNAYDRPLILSLFAHFAAFALYAAVLDSGALARRCGLVAAGYWVGVMILLARRRYSPTIMDRLYVALGFPVALVIVHIWLDGLRM